MSVIEQNLIQFLNRIGEGTHARHIFIDIAKYVPLMKQFPEITTQEIHRFKIYFTGAPANNHDYALKCLTTIAKNVPQVKSQIIKELGPVLYEYLPLWKGFNEYNSAQELFKVLDNPICNEDKYYKDIARSVILLHKPIIVVIGAGFSYDAMPITNEFQPLLITLLKEVGISSPKKMIQEDEKQAWRIVKENSALFKNLFSGWCARNSPAPQHNILAKMFYDGQISHLISFNWDDLIEKAYRNEFNEEIPKITREGDILPKPYLWKMHGDADDLSTDWVFPLEQGCVFNNLINSLNQNIKQNCPQFSLIIGYSENEEIVKERLINCLEEYIPTVLRVRPKLNVNKHDGIPENAKRFFERLNIYFEMEAKSH